MNVLLYALATVASGVLAIRAPLSDRSDPVRRAFSLLTSTVCVTYLGWTLYLLTGLAFFRYLNGVAAAFLPLTLLLFVDRFAWQPGGERDAADPRLRDLALLGPLVAIAYVAADVFFPIPVVHATVAEIVLCVFIFLSMLLPIHRLWRMHRAATQRIERARIRWFAGLAAAGIGLSALEALARALGPEIKPGAGMLARIVLMQGALPPLGALAATLFLYFLYQVVTRARLLDLGEMAARVASVSVAGAILVFLAWSSATELIGEYTLYWLSQVFMASCLFLLAYEPLRREIERWVGSVVNRPGQALDESLTRADQGLNRAISADMVTYALLARLVESGRVATASLYTWDEERRHYRLSSQRGEPLESPLLQVARSPFIDGFLAGERAYVRVDVALVAAPDEATSARLRVLDAMAADVAVPLRSGNLVLGWLCLRATPEHPGLSDSELTRLARLCARAAVVLENVHGFEKLKEESRLAALGTMAAGLAHEIRNPLAGIKGAAQFLGGSRAGPDGEMLGVIVEEVNRLDEVVRQFLDYARPFSLQLEEVEPGQLVGHVASLLRAQGPPSGIAIVEDLHAALPLLRADAAKLRQVLLNLGQNALHAVGQAGRITLSSRVGSLRDPEAKDAPAVEFAVTDTGTGIEPAHLDQLFVPFFTTRHDGTGLGLAISRRIVLAHKGEIDVHAPPGRGATFTVRIPLGGVEAIAAAG